MIEDIERDASPRRHATDWLALLAASPTLLIAAFLLVDALIPAAMHLVGGFTVTPADAMTALVLTSAGGAGIGLGRRLRTALRARRWVDGHLRAAALVLLTAALVITACWPTLCILAELAGDTLERALDWPIGVLLAHTAIALLFMGVLMLGSAGVGLGRDWRRRETARAATALG